MKTIDETIGGAGMADGVENIDGKPEQPKKRGPYKKTRDGDSGVRSEPKKQTGKKEKLSARQLTGMLYMAHAGVASVANFPAAAITEDEAGLIANALVDVLQFYDFEASAKTVAWCNLAGACATVYGLKILGYIQAERDHQARVNSQDLAGLAL